MKYALLNYKILNYTPHNVKILTEAPEINDYMVVSDYKSCGSARVATEQECVGEINGVKVYSTSYGEVEGLPEQQDGVMLLVSFLVKQALPEREDLICPNTSPQGVVRDSSGQIIGVKSFQV
jgi:hypothetical protein